MLSERDIELAHPEAFDFVWGNLPSAKGAEFNRHLGGCRYCQAVVDEYSDIGQVIKNLPLTSSRQPTLKTEPSHRDPPTRLEEPGLHRRLGTGKSRAAAAVARLYQDLGLIRYAQPIEIPAAEMVGAAANDTAAHVHQAISGAGHLILVTGAHAWHDLPGHGQDILHCLSQALTQARQHHHDELAVILSGQAAASTPAARQPRPGRPLPRRRQLPRLHARLARRHRHHPAGEAGLCLTPGADRKAAAVLADAEERHATGNARLAVRLLNQATTSQARRLIAGFPHLDPAALATICADDIPGQLPLEDPPSDHQRPRHYL